ncbi:hypothetical protein CQW23_00276 [Capsicum baccatum]|uniref:Uncharacterized protein n=1 Tax=Capsicum baccatum TaxID=33114 RepID=A0A2G2XK96_CAPBA|nr:hypothetical protein CQW23_00276 [Capsicum baccatum]
MVALKYPPCQLGCDCVGNACKLPGDPTPYEWPELIGVEIMKAKVTVETTNPNVTGVPLDSHRRCSSTDHMSTLINHEGDGEYDFVWQTVTFNKKKKPAISQPPSKDTLIVKVKTFDVDSGKFLNPNPSVTAQAKPSTSMTLGLSKIGPAQKQASSHKPTENGPPTTNESGPNPHQDQLRSVIMGQKLGPSNLRRNTLPFTEQQPKSTVGPIRPDLSTSSLPSINLIPTLNQTGSKRKENS